MTGDPEHLAGKAASFAGKAVLVTGASGFVGLHVCAELRRLGARVAGLARSPGPGVDLICDLAAASPASTAIANLAPDAVIHLAGAKGGSIEALFSVNVTGTQHLFDALVGCASQPRVVMVGSAAQFGATSLEGTRLGGDALQQPLGAYAASKSSACAVARAYAIRHGIPVVTAIPFNIMGPGQPESLAPAAFARQIAELEATGRPGKIMVGNLKNSRDFLDVRDVARAICGLALPGAGNGSYAIARGVSTPMAVILRMLMSHSRVPIDVVEVSEPMRMDTIEHQCGDPSALTSATGWKPQVDIAQSLLDGLDDWRLRVRKAAGAERSARNRITAL